MTTIHKRSIENEIHNSGGRMTVADLIRLLLQVDDITKPVYIYKYEDSRLAEIDVVDELSDRVDLNLREMA